MFLIITVCDKEVRLLLLLLDMSEEVESHHCSASAPCVSALRLAATE